MSARGRHPNSRANLRKGGAANLPETAVAPAPAGNGRALQHGACTSTPQRSPEWSPAVELCVLDLQERVDISLRDETGALHPWALPSVEVVAIQRVASVRMDRWVANREAKGKLDPADLDTQSKIGERYHRALEREALTLRSRIDALGLAQQIDVAKAWAARTAKGRRCPLTSMPRAGRCGRTAISWASRSSRSRTSSSRRS